MVYQFKIQLRGVVEPPIWRRIRIPADISFHQFHKIIQAAMGWENKHPYSFSPFGKDSIPQIKIPENSTNENLLDSQKMKLTEYFSLQKKRMVYTYDFVNDWVHALHLEKIQEEKLMHPEFLDGMGACPPEDCGGIWGYQKVKEYVKNPEGEEWHDVMKEMFGDLVNIGFDPENIDKEKHKLLLKTLDYK